MSNNCLKDSCDNFKLYYFNHIVESSNEPYYVISCLIEDAREDNEVSQFITKQDKFNNIFHKFFKNFGDQLDWNKFKRFINNSNYKWYEIDKPKLTERVSKISSKNYLEITVQFYYRTSREEYSDTITFSLEKFEGKWKALGILKGVSTVDVNK